MLKSRRSSVFRPSWFPQPVDTDTAGIHHYLEEEKQQTPKLTWHHRPQCWHLEASLCYCSCLCLWPHVVCFRPLKRTNTSSCLRGDYSYYSEDTIDLTSAWGRFETHSNSTLPNLTCSASENNGYTTNIEAWKIIALTSNVPFPDKCSAGCVATSRINIKRLARGQTCQDFALNCQFSPPTCQNGRSYGKVFSFFIYFFKSSCHLTGATPMSWFGQLPAHLLAHLSLIVPISVTIKAKLFPFSLIVRTCAVLYTAPLRPVGSLWIKPFFGEAFQTWFVKFCSFFCQMDFSVNNFLDPSFSFHFSVSDSW